MTSTAQHSTEQAIQYLDDLAKKIESGYIVGITIVTTDRQGSVSMVMPLIPSS